MQFLALPIYHGWRLLKKVKKGNFCKVNGAKSKEVSSVESCFTKRTLKDGPSPSFNATLGVFLIFPVERNKTCCDFP